MSKMIIQWIMYSKQNSTCRETGKKINQGDKILFIPSKPYQGIHNQVYCEDSKAYKEAEQDIARTGFKI